MSNTSLINLKSSLIASKIQSTNPALYDCLNTIINVLNTLNNEWILNGTNLFYNNGNVGINTNNPISSLTVNGPINFKAYTIATLPIIPNKGDVVYVVDATTSPSFGSIVNTTGTTICTVFYDGTNWVYR